MKKLVKAIAAIMLMTAVLFAAGCNKENNNSDVKVTTYTPQDITATTAICGGDVIVIQGLALSQLGICWSENHNPTVEDSFLSTTNWNEPFVCTIYGLNPNTKYYVRAYALRGLEYYYGEEKSLTTEEGENNGTYNGHDYIDLGLPSGTLWATCNVGANTPEEYGDYFAWGETEAKANYFWDTYKYCYFTINGCELTKYCSDSTYGYNGFTDDLITLQPADDAATANWGDGWCTPTPVQWLELKNNTTVEWTTQNGILGCLFTASNGNVLFLPAANVNGNGFLIYLNDCGGYWSSSLKEASPLSAWSFFFFLPVPDRDGVIGHRRADGHSVRPVRSAH